MKNLHIPLFVLIFILMTMTSLKSISETKINDNLLTTVTLQFDGYEGNTYFFTNQDNEAFMITSDGRRKLWQESTPNKTLVGQKFIVRYATTNNYKKSIIKIRDVIASWRLVENENTARKLD